MSMWAYELNIVISFGLFALMVWFKKGLSIPLGEASPSWVLSVFMVAIEKQSNRVSAIGACLAYVIDFELNIF